MTHAATISNVRVVGHGIRDERAWPGSPDIVGAFARDSVEPDEVEKIWSEFVAWAAAYEGDDLDLYVEASREDFDLAVPMGRDYIEQSIANYMDYIEANYSLKGDAAERSSRRRIETRAWSVDDYVRLVDEFESALTDIEDGIDAGDLDAATAQSKIDEIYQQMRNVADNVTVDGADEDPAYQQADDKFEGFFHWLTQIEERIKALAAERSSSRRIETRGLNTADAKGIYEGFIAEAVSLGDVDTVMEILNDLDDLTAKAEAAIEEINIASERSTAPRERRGWMSSIASSLGFGMSESDWNKAYNEVDDILRTNLSYANTGNATESEIATAVDELQALSDNIQSLSDNAPAGMDVTEEVAVLWRLWNDLGAALESATPAAA